MLRICGPLFLFGLLTVMASAHAQPPATASGPSAPSGQQAPQPAAPNHAPPTAEDICHAIEVDAAENELPVEFFARVIWQESRFNASAVSPKGAQGIAQFMPRTADFRGLADPFDPIAALHHAASYLSDLRKQFGNLGLAAAGYNAGPGRVSAWLAKQRELPSETRNYVAIITGWTADEWASPSPPKTSEITIPQDAPCTQLATLILAKPKDAQRIATYVPPWGAQFAADMSESVAWATYRRVHQRFAALIGNREPMVLRGRIPGRGFAQRYLIRIVDSSRTNMESLCEKIIAAGGGCAVLRNGPAVSVSPHAPSGSG
jgi:hypothetical protein